MDNLYYRLLLKKYLRRECTAEEAKTVLKWLQDQHNDAEIAEAMEEQWEETEESGLERINFENSWKRLEVKFSEKLAQETKRASVFSKLKTFVFPNYLSLVVVAGIIIAAALIILVLMHKGAQEISDNIQIAQAVVRSTNKGEKSTFKLSDGTKVYLNSNSKLTISADYGISNREVYLEGEAFFEVARDLKNPFRVSSGPLLTTALATSFNVQYFKNRKDAKVALASGQVSVNIKGDNQYSEVQEMLMPGEEAFFNNSQQTIEKNKVDTRIVTAWKDGVLIMKNADIDEIVEKLENWYAVEIDIFGSPGENWTFTGEFVNESLDNVLKGLSYSKGIEYAINNKKILIKLDHDKN